MYWSRIFSNVFRRIEDRDIGLKDLGSSSVPYLVWDYNIVDTLQLVGILLARVPLSSRRYGLITNSPFCNMTGMILSVPADLYGTK